MLVLSSEPLTNDPHLRHTYDTPTTHTHTHTQTNKQTRTHPFLSLCLFFSRLFSLPRNRRRRNPALVTSDATHHSHAPHQPNIRVQGQQTQSSLSSTFSSTLARKRPSVRPSAHNPMHARARRRSTPSVCLSISLPHFFFFFFFFFFFSVSIPCIYKTSSSRQQRARGHRKYHS